MSLAVQKPPQPSTEIDAIPATVAGMRAAFASGRTLPLAWRLEQLERLAALLREGADELVAALQADLRKPALEAWTSDIAFTLADVNHARKRLRRWARPERVRTPLLQRPGRARIVREPKGVVLVISAWNYPVQLLLMPLGAALAAGNCVVLKPSEVTPHTSEVLARLVPRYLDPACVAVVEGGVPETTALLRERFDHVFYTGNARVARVVMEAAARHLTPVTLELGGKSPSIVAEDADLESAARRIAWAKFLNAGQTCIAPDYVLVHAAREAELLEALKATLREFYGDDPRRSPDLARIVNASHFERLRALLGSGEVVVGGEIDEGERYLAPTILRNVDPHAPVMSEEIFGPILPVLRVPDADAAIEFVRARPKPLALYLFTRRPELEQRVLAGTSSGGVCVNGTLWHVANPALPFGGVGESGIGAYHGRHGFETFSHRRSVVRKPPRPDPRFGYPPYSKRKLAILKRML